ncbi:condensation domain-containing protein, partial [Nonomuraea angiospora]|uniref:condensation domain-containing protein n=1 Tax=Nonomuraea angiospora TaxID=46172 RepID=UPI00341479D6
YMVPSAFVQVPRIPLNNNGKLDRRALPAPDREALPAGHAYVAPRTPTEELVAGVWRDVLGVERVGVHDNFFDLGGHSIRAVALVGALRKNGIEVTVRDVFQHRTIAELMTHLPGPGTPAPATPTVRPFELLAEDDRAALPEGVTDAYPLAHVQAGMLLELMSGDERNYYHNVTSFRIRDERPFDPEAFRAAARLVTARHEVLRTSFDLDGYSIPIQLVHAAAELPVEVRELRHLDEAAIERALREFTAGERGRLFDLTRPGLIRLFAHVCDDETWWLSVTECHAILEGWSHHSMLMELLDHYRTLRDGGEPDPAPLPDLRYADFIAAELRSLDSHDDRTFWQGVVDDHPKLALPATWGDAERATRQVVVPFTGHEDGLRALATAAGVPLKSVLLAAHMKALSQITDQESFHTGLVLHGRPEIDGADRVYGLYLNTLPFPYVRGARTWTDLVSEVFATETDMWQHRQFPMAAIQKDAGARLVDSMFIYLDFDQVDTELVDYLASIDDSPTEFPLHVSVRVGHIAITVDTRVISEPNAARLGEMYAQVLTAMAADPHGDARAAFLPAADRRLLASLVPESSDTSRCVHEVFEERVRACPDAVAVVSGGERLTYRELNARANRLAHHLLGAGPLVGVCLRRGPELVPALLGVLKSGAGYVPLDPAVPAERLGGMLSDSGVSVVVTTSDLAPMLREVFTGTLVLLDETELSPHAADPRVPCSPGDAIYVIYTSGSTGRPKGVVLEHRNVLRLLKVAERHYGFSESDVWPLFHSFAFDVSV